MPKIISITTQFLKLKAELEANIDYFHKYQTNWQDEFKRALDILELSTNFLTSKPDAHDLIVFGQIKQYKNNLKQIEKIIVRVYKTELQSLLKRLERCNDNFLKLETRLNSPQKNAQIALEFLDVRTSLSTMLSRVEEIKEQVLNFINEASQILLKFTTIKEEFEQLTIQQDLEKVTGNTKKLIAQMDKICENSPKTGEVFTPMHASLLELTTKISKLSVEAEEKQGCSKELQFS